MNRYVVPAMAFVFGAIGIALAQTAALTPDQYIHARQAGMDMSASTFAELRLAAKDGLPVAKQAFPAAAIGRWARAIPSMFPEGTGPVSTKLTTHAKAEIWSDRAGFEKAAADYAAAADKLHDLAQAGDATGFADQLPVLDKTCDGCHDKYKSK